MGKLLVTRKGGGGLWDIATYFGARILRDWNANDASTVTTTSGSVTQWRSAGNVFPIDPASTGFPSYSATARNGKPGIVFTGNLIERLSGAATGLPSGTSSPMTMVVVGYADPASAGVFMTAAGYGGNVAAGDGRAIAKLTSDLVVLRTGVDSPTAVGWNGVDKIVIGEFQASGISVPAIDGTTDLKSLQSPYASIGSHVPNIALTQLRVGASINNTTPWNGVIQRILFISGTLTILEKDKLAARLAIEHNLTTLLPSAHPYKNVAPLVTSTLSTDVLAPYTRVWYNDFTRGVSFRTGGWFKGTTTGYNDLTSRGIWSINGENYMTSARGFGDFGYGYFVNPLGFDYTQYDPTFPTLGMMDVTDEGFHFKGSDQWPLIRAQLPLTSGRQSFLSSLASTTQGMKVRTPYVRRTLFKLHTMGDADFPAVWGNGEAYNGDTSHRHFELDDFERFGADNSDRLTAATTHIFSPAAGTLVTSGADTARFDMGTNLGPDILVEVVTLHRDDAIYFYTNGVQTTKVTPPADVDLTDRHHAILNMACGMGFERYPGLFTATTTSDTITVVQTLSPSTNIYPGFPVTGPGVVAGTTFLAYGTGGTTGAGRTGTYKLSQPVTSDSTVATTFFTDGILGSPEMIVQSMEVLKSSVDVNDLIPTDPPYPSIIWATGFISGPDCIIPSDTPTGTVVGSVSGAGGGGSYQIVPYNNSFNNLVISGINIVTSGDLSSFEGGSFFFYVQATSAAGTPCIGPKRTATISPPASDITPSAYRTLTQTAIMGFNQHRMIGYLPTLSSEFSISVWTRFIETHEGYVFNFFDPTATQGTPAVGGSTMQAMALYWSGTAGNALKMALTGTDKDGNHLSSSTITTSGGVAYGYFTSESLLNGGQTAILLTVQYRNGNIELWATYRGMRPRLLIQQACTWNGTSNPLHVFWGGVNFTGFNSVSAIELEMPTVIPDRSFSENDIAQLADGISPENINNGAAKATASVKFSNITDGTTTASDRMDAFSPLDGDLLTLNGAVYTFKNTPTLSTHLQTYIDYNANASWDVTTDTFTTATAHGFPNGRRISIHRSTMPGGVDNYRSYFIINATPTTFQISITLGGSAVDLTTSGSSATTRISTCAGVLDALCTQLNALTPNSGGASNATYTAFGPDGLFITSRSTGGTSFTFDCNSANVRFPTNKRLALAWSYITDYTSFRDSLFGSCGLLRIKSSIAWVVPTLGELAPNTQVTGSLRVTSWTDGMVSQQVSGSAPLLLSGIFTGASPSTGAQFKIYDLADNSQVQTFTSLTSFTFNAAAKTWTGKLTVPKGKRWLSLQAKKTGSSQVTQQSQVRWGIGEVVILMGRSIEAKLTNNTYTGTLPATNGFVSRFSGTGTVLGATTGSLPADNVWHVFDSTVQGGAGELAFANKVSNISGCVVGTVTRSVGGDPFVALTTSTVWNSLVADCSNTFTDSSLAPLAGYYLWTHGQEFPYYTLLDQLYTMLTQYFGSQTKLGVAPSSNFRTSPDNTLTDLVRVRLDMIRWLNDTSAGPHTVTPATWDSGRIIDLGDTDFFWSNTTDGVHPHDASDVTMMGELWAFSVLNKVGLSTYSGVGPVPVSATRSGAIVDVTFNHNGGTALQTPFVGDVGGFDVTLASNNFTADRSSVTINASTDLVLWTAHPLNNNDPVILTAGGSLPGGYTAGTALFVINKAINTFQLSSTVGGVAFDFTSTGSSLVAASNRALLAKTSVAILNSNTIRITLAANPGAPVAVNYFWGRPGRQAGDPSAALDPTSRSAMTDLYATAQGNILCDNFSMTYSNANVPGKPARGTVTPLVTAT